MSRRKKILHIVDKFGKDGSSVHGVTRLFSWWMPRFDVERFDVGLVGLRRADAASEALRTMGVESISLGKGKFDPSTVTALVSSIRKSDSDLVHLHGYGAATFGRIAARIARVPAVVHEHFVDPAMPVYQSVADRMLAGWTAWSIAVSPGVQEFMRTQRFLPVEKMSVIGNGVPLDSFQPVSEERVADERARWNIPEGYRIIASIGRLDPHKGNSDLLYAAARLLKNDSRIKVLLIGDGAERAGLQAKADELGIAPHVIFTGFQSDVRPVQTLVDIQVCGSRGEGWPLTVVEAMAMRRSIVATEVRGHVDHLRNGENALLVPPGNAEALAGALDRMLAEPELASRLAARAYEDSRALDIQHAVNRIQEIYDKLLGAEPRGSESSAKKWETDRAHKTA